MKSSNLKQIISAAAIASVALVSTPAYADGEKDAPADICAYIADSVAPVSYDYPYKRRERDGKVDTPEEAKILGYCLDKNRPSLVLAITGDPRLKEVWQDSRWQGSRDRQNLVEMDGTKNFRKSAESLYDILHAPGIAKCGTNHYGFAEITPGGGLGQIFLVNNKTGMPVGTTGFSFPVTRYMATRRGEMRPTGNGGCF